MLLPFLLHILPHSNKARMLLHKNKHGENPKTRRAGAMGSGLLAVFVSRYRFTAVFAIWGNWSVIPIVKCCTVATAAGLKQSTEEPAKSLLDLRCGMVNGVPPDYTLQASCRSAGDCRGWAVAGLLTLTAQVLGGCLGKPQPPFC